MLQNSHAHALLKCISYKRHHTFTDDIILEWTVIYTLCINEIGESTAAKKRTSSLPNQKRAYQIFSSQVLSCILQISCDKSKMCQTKSPDFTNALACSRNAPSKLIHLNIRQNPWLKIPLCLDSTENTDRTRGDLLLLSSSNFSAKYNLVLDFYAAQSIKI